MKTRCWQLVLMFVLVCAVDAGAVDVTPQRDGYRIGPNDVIRVQVFGEDDLTIENKVSGDGKMNYPLLGVLQVEGQTIEELQRELTVRLGSGYVRLPKVSVSIVRHRNFYVSGEVKTPGGYPYEEGLTVQKALSIAGGLTEKSDKQGIKVTRLTDGRAETLAIGPDGVVQPNDILIVATQNHKFYVSGEVKTAGVYPYADGLSVHKAIAMAGGLTDKAERETIQLLRHTSKGEETLSVKLETSVLPDDVIVIAEAHRVYLTGEVRTPGRYFYEPGMTVQRALTLAGGVTDKADKQDIKLTRLTDRRIETLPIGPDDVIQPNDILMVATQNRKFYVSGQVKTPGAYPYGDGLSVQKAIAMAGGFTEKSDKSGVKVTRPNDKSMEVLLLDADAVVMPDDMIVVAQLQKFYVNGEVKKPGDFTYETGMTVHKAIAMAGGFTDKAAMKRANVLRNINGKESTIELPLDGTLLPEDIIVVRQRFF